MKLINTLNLTQIIPELKEGDEVLSMITSPLGAWIGFILNKNRVIVGRLEKSEEFSLSICGTKEFYDIYDVKDGLKITDEG
jgi:hypothetical protein